VFDKGMEIKDLIEGSGKNDKWPITNC
jgi:hypothetical protein